MKKVLLLLLLLTTSLYSQEKKNIKGIVLVFDNPYKNVSVKNLSSNKEVVTNERGEFILGANPKDTLLFSSIQLMNLRFIVLEKHFGTSNLEVPMDKKTIKLKEVIIKNGPNINAVSLGIISKNQKKFTPTERRLYTAGDFKPIHLLGVLTGCLAIDPIINSINGKTTRLKKEIKIEKNESNLEFLVNNYYSYLNDNLKLSNDEINKIFYYAIEEKDIQILIDNNENEKIKFLLCDIKSKI
ncbi:hypothetical protein [Flavobacterium psychrophilum]|uniref:hypothetical protein n=1 Tax=Flavobacterium psychrophilum TaxID=96345 RepID=UPI0006187CC6|nr:hypothetical protein [Flavobacterium psychrophilum]OAE93952.1 hypothetical protein SU65_01150 [Flavobacterium psychrophilum]